MINEYYAKKFCCEDISLIENYMQAFFDQTQIWDCHHRREISEHLSKKELISRNQYFGVQASELIFLTKAEHRSLHHLGKHNSVEVRAKMSAAKKGEKMVCLASAILKKHLQKWVLQSKACVFSTMEKSMSEQQLVQKDLFMED